VLCASDNSLRYYCRFRSMFLLDQSGVIFIDTQPGEVRLGVPDVGVGANDLPAVFAPDGPLVPPERREVQPADVVPIGVTSNSVWEKTVATWLVLSLVFLVLSVQFVSPTRRWHPRRGPGHRRGTD